MWISSQQVLARYCLVAKKSRLEIGGDGNLLESLNKRSKQNGRPFLLGTAQPGCSPNGRSLERALANLQDRLHHYTGAAPLARESITQSDRADGGP